MTLADLTIRRFMDALFNGKREGIPDWQTLYTEYIDASGMGKSRELLLLTGIHNLTTRLHSISAFISLQQDFMIHFGQPLEKYERDGVAYTPFEDVRHFGHRIAYNADKPEQFAKDLLKIDIKERRNVAELAKLEKELADIQAPGKPKETADSRKDFTRMLTVLNREGYRFDKDTTYMDELCDMIADNNERVAAQLEAQQNRKK